MRERKVTSLEVDPEFWKTEEKEIVLDSIAAHPSAWPTVAGYREVVLWTHQVLTAAREQGLIAK